MNVTQKVREIVERSLLTSPFELIDIESHQNLLRITLDREGGIDLDDIGEASKIISLALDEDDIFPNRYTLEVSSPGLERPLRTPEHFARFVGSLVLIKTTSEPELGRRVKATLIQADDSGITIELMGSSDRHYVAYDHIERANTIVDWEKEFKSSSSTTAKPSKKTKQANTEGFKSKEGV